VEIGLRTDLQLTGEPALSRKEYSDSLGYIRLEPIHIVVSEAMQARFWWGENWV